MKIEIKRLTTILLITLMILPLGIIGAVPQMPHQFYGTVTIDGVAAPDGVSVDAKIEGITYLSTTTLGGQYGYAPLFKILADDPDVVGIDGGVAGDTVEFYVDGVLATPTFIFEYGIMTDLDLVATGAPVETDTGTLYINTEPFGGQVFVEGDYWGMSPQTRVVDVGVYTVSFGAVAGYTTPATVEATVSADETGEVIGVYVPIAGETGTLSIDTTPVKGAVYVDGNYWGTAPKSQVVAVGAHAVSYGAVAGYTTPSPVSATVTTGTVTPVMGTYVATAVPPSGELITKIQYFDDPDWIDWAAPVQKGDEIRVVGKGVTAGATVNVFWDNAIKETFTDGSGKVASGTAKSAGTFSIKFLVPEGLVGTHYIWVKDVATGRTESIAVNIAPKMTVSPSSGLKGDKVTMTGYGYGYDDDNDKGLEVTIDFSDFGATVTPSPTEPKTNSLGTWTAIFTVPDIDYNPYYLYAQDDELNADTDGVKFTAGASITLSISTGPVGSVVTITGRGFVKEDTLTVDIAGASCYIVSGESVRSDGRISAKVVIPNKDLDVDDEPVKYTITVQDESGNAPTAKFTVDGIAEIKATPSYGPQGSQITVEGWNFTKISGTEVRVTLGGESAKKYKTDSNGYFKGTFSIPAVASGDPVLLAETVDIDGENYEINAVSTVRVGIMLTILTPNTGPSGTMISITGVGFTEGEPYTVYIGDDEWFTGNVDAGGTLSDQDNVPTLVPGVYEIKIVDEDTEIEVSATFTVTEKTKLVLTPSEAPNEYDVKVEGWYFAELPVDASLEFILYNSTQEWPLVPQYEAKDVVLEADADWDAGYFEATFEVPDDASISIGAYTLNVTDGEGMFAQIAFKVVEKTQSIAPRKSVFVISDTVSFNVETSFIVEDSYIKINSPSGDLYWLTEAFGEDVWTTVGTVSRVPYYYQTAGGNPMVLLTDAPIGTYTWKYYDLDDELLDSGSFTVNAAPTDVLTGQVDDLANQITDLADQLTDVTGEFAGVKSDIASVAALAQQAVTAAQQAAQAVQTVATTANQANTAAQAAADAANAAKDAANGLTTLVYGAIGAALVAALAAIVSLMQISRRIAG